MKPALSLALALAGCTGGANADVDGGVPPVMDATTRDVRALDAQFPDVGDAEIPPLDDTIVAFCADLGDALCAALEGCTCGTTDDAACRSGYREQCELGLFTPDVRIALADGRLVFEATAASRMLSALRDAALCTRRTLLPWTARDYYTFGGILEGTRPAGDACSPFGDPSFYGFVRFFRIDECAEGVCDAGRCVGFSGVGGTCDASHFCADLDREVRFSWDLQSTSLPCTRPSPDAPSGSCAARHANGSPCDRASECVSNWCDSGECVALGAVGAECIYPYQCQSGFCGPGSGTRVCGVGNLPTGSPCNYNGLECASGFCAWDSGAQTCRAGICTVSYNYGNLAGLFPRR
jgi:hypothetical protein